ncbi:hypothetical protein [Cohnella rhizosphaerae]|uniref:Uncharacterized protein n=1 Tax=Cohnella rhizosphaerae TaxID=1457232 RepID=A0A9X4KXS2_9BACL|nr:hypothetical protein [Cohnella rhizosphaerae]MDG0810249.1 hypothetical protein [Cohnella rhizosphaerae]
MRITLRSDGDRRVNFGRIWAYDDFEALAAAEAVNRPMKTGLFQPALNWHDYAADLALVRSLVQPYEGLSMYEPAIAFDILYMHWEKEELHRRLDYLLALSRDTGLPVHLSLNAWWGGTPTGPDGKGGYWTDIAYNQIVYDPLNIDGRGNWKLSTPNIWSNTPWLTMNNDHYNEVRADKVRDIAAYLSRRTSELKAEGSSIAPVSVFTENEPLYWPFFAFNASPEAGGDFGPEVIADAARDGVTLDPEDGLSPREKEWMVRNLTSYITTLSGAIASGYGYDAIVVDGDRIAYPEEQLVDNAYTHMFPTPNYPDWDEKRGAWETHMVRDIRYGGEWAGDMDPRYLDYIVARGKYADVNAERSSVTDLTMLKQAYSYGADYVNIYNFKPEDGTLVRGMDGVRQDKTAVPAYDVPLVDYAFRDEHSLEANESLVAARGVKRDVLGEKLVVTADSGDAAGGSLTFRADNGGEPLTHGLAVQVQGRALSELSATSRVEIWAGRDQAHLSPVKTLKNFSTAYVDVSDAIDRTSNVAYVELRLYSEGLPDSLYSWTSVWSVKMYAKREHASGQADGSRYTVDESRERNLWTGYRADAERLLGLYRQKAGGRRYL